jgi:transcriptional repressor NrdR
MKCPFCDFHESQVKDSRPSDDGLNIKRRRYCPKCTARFTTFERLEVRELTVTKRNLTKRPFDSSKIIRSIELAMRKRPVSAEQIEDIVSRLLQSLQRLGENEISTKTIGQLVMKELAEVDPVAYVRYASVYMDFSDINQFSAFIDNLKVKTL